MFEEKKETSFWMGCSLFVSGVLLMVVALFVKGLVAVQIWEWFIVPAFELKPLTIPIALGLSTFISLMNPSFNSSNDNKFFKTMTTSIIFSLVCLFFAWIINMFM